MRNTSLDLTMNFGLLSFTAAVAKDVVESDIVDSPRHPALHSIVVRSNPHLLKARNTQIPASVFFA